MSARVRIAAAALAAAAFAGSARGARAQDARAIDDRLSPAARAAVQAIADSARAEGLPGDPLLLKALEGASKGASDARIIAAVRTLHDELREARRLVGASAGADELTAAASALRAGVAPAAVARLRASRPDAPITVPLAVLTDLIARGVPADTAASLIHELAERGAPDDGFFALRTGVERDIMAGAAPVGAATARARQVRSMPARSALPPP